MKKLKFLYFIIISVEIRLVELKLKFVAFCYAEIGPFFLQKWTKLCHFWPKMTKNERLSDFYPNYVLPFPNFVYNF